MNCPVCNQSMEILAKDASSSKNKQKQYDRTRYVCKKDDAWIVAEIPQREPQQK